MNAQSTFFPISTVLEQTTSKDPTSENPYIQLPMTQRQRLFLISLIEKQISNEFDRNLHMKRMATMSRKQASDAIQRLLVRNTPLAF